VDSWKEFEQNPITHSAAHHLVAIWELLEEYGYARVSDVARLLEITRGSASITLKGLKSRGLVTEDDRRFLGLSPNGEKIARSVLAKKRLMRKFFVDILKVNSEQADTDTCKIEHLLSNHTVERVARLFRFLESGDPAARAFVVAFERYDRACTADPSICPVCDFECLVAEMTGDFDPGKRKKG